MKKTLSLFLLLSVSHAVLADDGVPSFDFSAHVASIKDTAHSAAAAVKEAVTNLNKVEMTGTAGTEVDISLAPGSATVAQSAQEAADAIVKVAKDLNKSTLSDGTAANDLGNLSSVINPTDPATKTVGLVQQVKNAFTAGYTTSVSAVKDHPYIVAGVATVAVVAVAAYVYHKKAKKTAAQF